MLAYLTNLAVLISINAILAVTLNFVLGYAGIFSMAHAVFFGVGAYTAAFVAIKVGGGFLLATGAGMAVAALISLALALPALRVRGEYFVAASLGLQMLAITVFSEWKAFTGGIGSLTGAACGGLLLGLAESVALWKLDAQWSEGVTFVILFVFIIFRPAGFLGRPLGAK